MSNILEKLFNSKPRAKILKLIFRNPNFIFKAQEVAQRTKVDYYAARRELYRLVSVGLLKFKAIPSSNQKGFFLNSDFDFYKELKILVLKTSPISNDKLLRRFRKLGKLKLVLLSGVFINQEKSRSDLLLVGDGIHQNQVDNLIKDLESEVGKEIVYAFMTTEEFKYRKNMFDKFVLEALEGPKDVLWDSIGATR